MKPLSIHPDLDCSAEMAGQDSRLLVVVVMAMVLVGKTTGEQLKEGGVLVLTDDNFDQVTFIGCRSW